MPPSKSDAVKRPLLFALAAALVALCVFTATAQSWLPQPEGTRHVYRGPTDESVILSTWAFVSSVRYVARDDDRWLEPPAFVRLGGVCRDFATAEVALLEANDIESRVVVIASKDGAHALVEARLGMSWIAFDPQVFGPFVDLSHERVLERVPFSVLRNRAHFTTTSGLTF